MNKARAALLLLIAIAISALAWSGLRGAVEAQLTGAAERDLHTIADLVAAEVQAGSGVRPGLRGLDLALAGDSGPLREALRRAHEEQFRNTYFFDAQGRTLAPGSRQPAAAETAPRIVRLALAQRLRDASVVSGALAEPYADAGGAPAVGVWRWLPEQELGVVTERPHDRLAQPLVWIDRAFGVLVALFVGSAFLLGLPSLAEMRRAFRGSDIDHCGPYLIDRQIGEGTLANVYLARDPRLGRRVAVKRLKAQAQTDESLARFQREARLASGLAHPNIVTILDYGPVPGGGFFYAMEYIRGLTLTQWVEDHGPIPPARALRLMVQLCDAVAAMHGAGLLHRDIKPANVMAHAAHGDHDLVKLLDFGLIRNFSGDHSRDLTRNVRILGTPAFMAPERLTDPTCVDPRTDVYGIGAVAYYILTGHKPFESQNDADLVQQVLHVEAPRARQRSPFPLPDALDELVARTLSKDMARRPASAADLGAELAALAPLLPWRTDLARLWWLSAVAQHAPDRAAPTQP